MLRRRVWLAAAMLIVAGCSQPTQTTGTKKGSGPQEPLDSRSAQPESPPGGAGPTAQDLIVQARQAGTRKQGEAPNFEGSIKQLEQALEQEPDNPMALRMLIELTHNHGMVLAQHGDKEKADSMHLKSATYLRRIRQGAEPLDAQQKDLAPVLFYHEACALARQQQVEKAVASLKEAVDAGFMDFELIDKNPDFDAIREVPEFQAWRKQAA